MKRTVLAVLAILLIGVAAPAWAQTTISGSLQGVARDQRGAVLPGVTVVATSPALIKGLATAVTNAQGVYRFPGLPPGTYVVEGNFPGMKSPKYAGTLIRAGQALTLDIALQAAEVKEEITVSGKPPVFSVSETAIGTNFDADFVERQPIPRNFYQVIQSAPGVNVDYTGSSGSAMLAYGGTTENQNAFSLDGVNVADAAGGSHWLLPSISWMQSIEVGGLGADAEYGGFTGGRINGVTKSGSNEFHGDVEVYYQPKSWASSTADTSGGQDDFRFEDISVTAGGPVVKDKAWFFVSGEYWRQVTSPIGAKESSDRKIPRFMGKLTWQVNDANKLMLMVEYEAANHERRGVGRYVLPEASSHQKAPGLAAALHWESSINANNFVSVKLTGYDGRDDFLPYHGEDTPGRIDDGNTGIAWQNQDIREINHRRIMSLEGAWSLYVDGLFGARDSHRFKFGVSGEDAVSSDQWRRNGGFTYYDDSSACEGGWSEYRSNPQCGAWYVERGWGEYDESPRYSGYAAFAQDSMRIGDWTVNPGLRYGRYMAGWQSGHGKNNVYDVEYWDPRLGVVWDIGGKGRTAIKAHWGRYHDKMYTYMFDRETSGAAAIPDQDCYWDSETGLYSDCDQPSAVRARMGKVRHPYTDEWLVTFEQALGKDMVVGVDYIDRKFRHIMTMVNVNHDYYRVDVENPLLGGTFPAYVLESAPDYVLTTEAGGRRDFKSVVARFEKRPSDKWAARASLVWTDLKGNVVKNNGYADEFADRNGMVNADGRMDMSYSEWEFKLNGSYDLPWGFQVSGQYTYLSGWYWTPYVRLSDLLSYGYNNAGRYVNITPRGDEQLPNRQLLDLRLAYTARVGKGMNLTAQVECFNALNRDTVLEVAGRYANCYVEDGTCGSRRSTYGTATRIEAPRQIRAGLRFSY